MLGTHMQLIALSGKRHLLLSFTQTLLFLISALIVTTCAADTEFVLR